MRVFTKVELWQLRNEIVLNSLYEKDYSNSFGISEGVCQDFFDGYVEELCLKAKDDDFNEDFVDILNFYDTPDNLFNYYSSCENAFDYI